MSTITERATKAFRTKLRKKISTISHCYAGHLGTQLEIVSDTIAAARTMEVTKAQVLTEEEIEQTTEALSPLCELEMDDDAKRVLIKLLLSKGITEEELGEDNILYYSFDEALEKLNIDEAQLKSLVSDDRLSAYRENGETKFKCSEVDARVDAQHQPA